MRVGGAAVRDQRWSPRGHILKSLASKPQVLENCPVLGSRTALFFEPLKFCWKAPETSQKICEDLFLLSSRGNRLKKKFWRPFSPEKVFWKPCFWDRLKIFLKTFLFLENTCACVLRPWPWPRESLSLASRVSVLGKAVLGLILEFFFVFLSLACSLVSSTPSQFEIKASLFTVFNYLHYFAWVKSQVIPFIIINISLIYQVLSCSTSSFPVALASKSWLEVFFEAFCLYGRIMGDMTERANELVKAILAR